MFRWPGRPNFFCIGAMRAGSTSLYQYLRQHPDILMSTEKETDFFSLGDLPQRELPNGAFLYRSATAAEYRQKFARWQGERAVGEVSPSYMYYARTAARLHQAVPDAKIICCLRDPVERAYSHYSLNRKVDIEPVHSFREALDQEAQRTHWGHRFAYVGMSLYDQQLARYQELFEASRIHVMLFDDFTRNPAAALRDIFRFLNVDESFEPDTSVRHNRSGVMRNRLLRRMGRPTRIRRWLLRNLPPGPVSRLGRVLMRSLPRVETEVRERLNETFRDDLLRLEARIGRDLSHWRRPPSTTTSAAEVVLGSPTGQSTRA